MRYHALACDYDGTIALNGSVDESTLGALTRVRRSGRKIILITGRELDDLIVAFPNIEIFDYVVAENGALLYRPATREEKMLSERPPDAFIASLRERGVSPLSVGRTIVATWQPNETIVLKAIRELGLELQVIFNKGAVMVLPSGVNKATGLTAALGELGLSPHNVVGVGDAENDHAFLGLCECSVAVANALPMLKERADFVTSKDHGAGVTELIDDLLSSDLKTAEPKLQRHEILLGTREDGEEVRIKPYGMTVLLAGTSGSGKSTLALGFLEGLTEQGYQYCIIDPEGDYQDMEQTVVLGDSDHAPSEEEIVGLLDKPTQNAVVNLLGIGLQHRPVFFEGLLPHLLELRARSGRPHWLVIDEAHHLLPSSWNPSTLAFPEERHGTMLITVHPDHVARHVLTGVDLMIAIGESPEQTIRTFSRTLGEPEPSLPEIKLGPGEAIAWRTRPEPEIFWFRSIPPRVEHRRHTRKYAEGELGEDKSFYFRGPDGQLNLRAQNLELFNQIAEGVDDKTWMHHLRRGDYSRWFREQIKDESLASEAEAIESMDVSAGESRQRIKEAIETRYTRSA